MKKIVLSLLLVAGVTFGIVSCSEEALDPQAAVQNSINVSSPTGGSFVLTGATAGNNVFTVKWSSADFGYSAAVTYSLKVVKATGATTPQYFVLGSFNENSNSIHEKALTQRQLNSMLLGAGGSIGSSDSYKLSVEAKPSTQLSGSTNGVMATSQQVTFSGNPYDTFDEFDRLYVPGNYQGTSGYGSSWSPGDTNVAKLFSANNNGNYEGFVWMNDATPAFKFTPVPAWSGDRGESNPSGAFSGILGGNDIKPTDGAGTYFFTVNWPALTYTMSKRQVAIIGQATPAGWGSATYLTFDTNPASPYYQMYTIDLYLTVDEFLIRLKDDWSEKMGNFGNNGDFITTGGQYKVKIGGNNMKVPTAGNYHIVLDIRNSANYNLRLYPY